MHGEDTYAKLTIEGIKRIRTAFYKYTSTQKRQFDLGIRLEMELKLSHVIDLIKQVYLQDKEVIQNWKNPYLVAQAPDFKLPAVDESDSGEETKLNDKSELHYSMSNQGK